ncbi:MAG: HAMP domain-containing histidine kinase [Rhodoferax sp.]|nr:HAMP domain-containing histidine kinase [Rhodoferax sp.]
MPTSLRRELARTLTLISGVWLLAVFLVMAFGIRHEVDDLLDDALQESAEVLWGTLVLHGPDLHREQGPVLPAPPHDERLVWQILEGDGGRVLLRSHKAPAVALLDRFERGPLDTPTHWRVYALRLPESQRFLVVGQPRFERLESRYEVIALVGASGLVVGGICAVWLRRRVMALMQELQALSRQIQAYDPMQPITNLPVAQRQEFVQVRDAVHDLGRRLARRIESEQAFAAHAAHALRTPLAGVDAQLAMALREVGSTAQPRIARSREALARLKRVITALLTLFRSQADLDLQPIDLPRLIAHLPVEGLQVHVLQDQPLRADANLLAAVLSNLLDNAARYGAHNCWVRAAHEGGGQFLSVRDDGPGVEPQQRAGLQALVDREAGEGFAGLGLQLAAVVARAHGGRLVLDAAESGFALTLHLGTGTPDAGPGQKS